MHSQQNVPASLRVRFNPFNVAHKSLRLALGEQLGRMGAHGVDSPEAVARLRAELAEVLELCERHVEHEERFMRPACAGKLSCVAFDTGHPTHERLIAELRALSQGLADAPSERRAAAAHALYLHFSVFVAESLLHMAEEERVLVPLIQRVLSDVELLAVQGQVLDSMGPEELARSVRFMVRSLSRVEQLNVIRGMLAKAPLQAVLGLIESARPSLTHEAFEQLLQVVEQASSSAA